MREIFDLLTRFDPNIAWDVDEVRFEFKTAPSYLSPRFQEIELEGFDNMLLVTEPAPLVDYVYSLSPPFVLAASRKTEFYNFVVRELEGLGPIRITRDLGIVAATRCSNFSDAFLIGPQGCPLVCGQWFIFNYEQTVQHRTYLIHQRRSATPDQTNSTTPNGHAPCRKPYADAARQAPANSKTKMGERLSSA